MLNRFQQYAHHYLPGVPPMSDLSAHQGISLTKTTVQNARDEIYQPPNLATKIAILDNN
jgi:hypothetical protein